MEDQDFGKKWGLAIGFIVITVVLAVLFYILFSVVYGSPWPHEWRQKDGYWYYLFFGDIILLAVANYFVTSKRIDVEGVLRKLFNLDELENNKPIEAILAHYTNMASVGLLLAIVIYTIKPLVESQSLYVVGPLLAVIVFFLFLVYGALLIKPLFCFSRYSIWIAMPVMYALIFVDTQGFRLFISSIPD